MLRALLDANVYLSYLLSSSPRVTPPVVVVESALARSYTLLLTAGVIAEVRDKSENKPYLAARIAQHETEQLIQALGTVAEIVPEPNPPLPEVGRDRKDDYLFAHATFGEADYLVTSDIGVQEIGRLGNVQIVSPAGFIRVLQEADQLPLTIFSSEE